MVVKVIMPKAIIRSSGWHHNLLIAPLACFQSACPHGNHAPMATMLLWQPCSHGSHAPTATMLPWQPCSHENHAPTARKESCVGKLSQLMLKSRPAVNHYTADITCLLSKWVTHGSMWSALFIHLVGRPSIRHSKNFRVGHCRQICQPNVLIPAVLKGTSDAYHFIPLSVILRSAGQQKAKPICFNFLCTF